ncbi:MAG: zinc ribbon domain-containing protein [Candidatus Bathyarchaeota archaeon]|nr:zinc ribbon domain-containing protein [Candidatus Bathyarchaeota archaeon]
MESKTKFCSNCGATIDKNAEICPKCGVRVSPPPSVSTPQVTIPPPKKGLLTKRNVVIGVVVLIVLVMLGGGGGAGSPISTPKTVIVEVQYGGQWQGALMNGVSSSVSWSGTGTTTRTLSAPSSGPWIVSVNAQKMGSDSNILVLRIKASDGKILAEQSTTTAYGIVQLTYTVS